jgi:hypothetical protein
MPVEAGTTFFVPAASEQEAFRAEPQGPLVVIKCFPPGPWADPRRAPTETLDNARHL